MAKANQRVGWRKSKSRAVASSNPEFGQRGRERRKLLFMVSMLTTFAVVLAVVLIQLLMRAPERDVPLIVSVVSESGARNRDDALFIAPNAYAKEDVDLLEAWFRDGPSDPKENVALIGDPAARDGVMGHATSRLIEAIVKPLATAVAGGSDNDLVAIYLSAHGFVDRGTPYLAVGDSRADRVSTWVRFEDLFQSLIATLEERESDGDPVRVVMFIDAARVGPQWDWGHYTESFAESCKQITSGETERVAIILSASPGERSWWDPRRGHGLFTQAMVEALTGKADLDGNSTVTVGEIADYMTTQVQQLAAGIWDARQTPMLLTKQSEGSARDWPFITQPPKVAAPAWESVSVQELRKDLDEIDQLWQRHNRLAQKNHSPLAFNPLAWSTLEKKLSRLDSLCFGGKGYDSQFDSLRAECNALLQAFENGPDTIPRQESLPELALRDYFHEVPPSSEEQLETIKAWREKPAVDAVQIPLTETQTTRFLWRWLREKNFDRSSVELASQLLEKLELVTQQRQPRLWESYLIRLVSAPDLSHVTDQHASAIASSHEQSRRALCPSDLRAAFWIRKRLQALNEQRLVSIDQMLTKDPEKQSLGASRANREIREDAEQLSQTAERISAAYKLRDEMLHSIPRIAETLMTDSQAFANQERLPDSQSRTVVKRCIESLGKLVDALQLKRDDDPRPIQELEPAIYRAREDAEIAFNTLKKRIKDRLSEAIAQTAGDASGLRQNFALLVGSGTNQAELRQRVHDRLCELLENQSAALGSLQAGSLGSSTDEETDVLALMTIDGRHVWDHWMQSSAYVSGSISNSAPSIDTAETGVALPLETAFQNAGANFRSTAAALSQGELSERVTAEEVLQQPLQAAKNGESLATVRRELSQWDTFLRSRTLLFTHVPSNVEQIGRGRFALDQQLFLYDHAARTMDECWCGARRNEASFFVDASSRLLNSRNQNPLYSQLAMKLDGTSLSERQSDLQLAVDQLRTLQPQPSEQNRNGTLEKFVAGKEVEFVLDCPSVLPTGVASVWASQDEQASAVALTEDNTASFPMTIPENLASDVNSFQPNLFFRGIRRSGRLNIKRLIGGLKTVFRLPEYGPPAVRVVRETKEPERLVLVLDCSRSMRSGGEKGRSRLTVARQAINDFLKNLSPDVEVGLVVFGDRYGFLQKLDAQGVPQIEIVNGKIQVLELQNGKEIEVAMIEPDEQVGYNPNFDVRVVAPIKPIDKNHFGSLRNELRNVGAIGVTPTYLGIKRGYELLGTRSGHVIVLTDGKPKVISSRSVPVNDSRQTAIGLVNGRKNVQLTIVQYQNGNQELQKAFPMASTLQAASGKDLLRHLESVRPKSTVVWERRREQASRDGEFQNLVAVSQWPPSGVDSKAGQPVIPPQPYTVQAVAPGLKAPLKGEADLNVQGGEQFEMLFSDSGLTHRPFDYQYTQLQRIGSSLVDGARFRISCGPASRRDNRTLSLQIAIESASGGQSNGKFTPRPSDIWVELTGVDSRQANRRNQRTYLFSMPEFEMNQPIPILLCRATDFPGQFDQASVKAWMRFAQEPLEGLAIPISADKPQALPNLDGVTFLVERSLNSSNGTSLVITEQYSDGRSPGSVRVLSNPLPKQASIEVYEQENVVVRTLDFEDADSSITLSAIGSDKLKQACKLLAEGTVGIDFDSK